MVRSRGYTQETALSQRVQDWKDVIQPELLRLVKHPPWLQPCCRPLLSCCPLSCRRSVQPLTSTTTATEWWQRWAALVIAALLPPSLLVWTTLRPVNICWLRCSW